MVGKQFSAGEMPSRGQGTVSLKDTVDHALGF